MYKSTLVVEKVGFVRKDPRSTVGYNLKSKADDLSQPFFKRKQVGDVSSHLPNRGQGEAWG